MLSQLLEKAKTQIKPVVANVERILSPITEFTRANPLISGIALGGTAGVATSAIVGAVRKRSKRKSTRKKTKRKSKKRTRRRTRRRTTRTKRRVKKKWYGKTRGKKIKYTKNGQPYVILKSGKARFIKKKRSKRMKKMKGGYY